MSSLDDQARNALRVVSKEINELADDAPFAARTRLRRAVRLAQSAAKVLELSDAVFLMDALMNELLEGRR